jgi:hypothetical protein
MPLEVFKVEPKGRTEVKVTVVSESQVEVTGREARELAIASAGLGVGSGIAGRGDSGWIPNGATESLSEAEMLAGKIKTGQGRWAQEWRVQGQV